MQRFTFSCLVLVAAFGFVVADEPANEPRPVPLTRPEMKKLLEDMKDRKPRIPRPELTEEERARLRASGRGPGGGIFWVGRENDPNISLDNTFKTKLFWIVSRANNCQYCLGHQEVKLAVAGVTEDEIASLDGDWAEFTAPQRAAFAFARKLSYEPHRISDSDIAGLRAHYTDLQILEMILSIAGNNAINRSHEGRGNPQSRDLSNFAQRAEKPVDPQRVLPTKTFLTPTSEKYQNLVSKVAPLSIDEATGKPSTRAINRRPPLEPRDSVEKALAECRQRLPRLPLVDEAKTRELLPMEWGNQPVSQWERLLANFPKAGIGRILAGKDAEEKNELSPLLKAQVSWIIARQDRAWYAVAEAKNRLHQLGWTDDQIYKLDGDWSEFSPKERALFTFARNLAASPVVLTDLQAEEAVKLAGTKDVGQLISYVTNRASFDRITEAAGLRADK